MRKRFIVIFTLFLMILLGISPAKEVMAKERNTVDISDGNVFIKKSGDYNLVGNTKENRLIIEKGAKVNLWISNLSVEWSDYEYGFPIFVESGSTLNLIVAGKNSVTNNTGGDAIYVEKGGKLSISKYSTGTLTCVGSIFGSGIGGEGNIVINGGTINATGGVYGAGIGNCKNPIATLTINGGKVVVRGGITPKEVGTHYDENTYSYEFKEPDVYDVCVGQFVITGGDIHLDTTIKEPVNKKGEKLERIIFNCEKGKVKTITVNGKEYGTNGVVSSGYLSLWIDKDVKTMVNDDTEKKELNVVVTLKNGKKTIQNVADGWEIYTDDVGDDLTLDISKSSIEFFYAGFIYNNHVYKADYRTWHKIIGSTYCNQIYVNSGINYLDFNNVSYNGSERDQDFLILGCEADVTLRYTGKNTFTTNKDNHAITIGNHAEISFVGDIEKGTLKFNNDNGYGSIFTANGTINQCGGTIVMNAKGNGIGMVLGDSGVFCLYGGSFNGSSEGTHSIYGSFGIKVCVFGGELIADTIGYRDEANEEMSDYSGFECYGGLTKISNRMIFKFIWVYGGEIDAHLLGSGSGSYYRQYNGKVHIDKYITDYTESEDYIFGDEVIKESLMDASNIYGGTYEETHNVTEEELEEKISFGRC